MQKLKVEKKVVKLEKMVDANSQPEGFCILTFNLL